MKRFIIFSIVHSLLSIVCLTDIARADSEWKEIKGDHFIVMYLSDELHAKEVAHKAEGYYRKVADDIGYGRYSKFWSWENRVKIYIHPSKEAFQKATGQPAWSDGMAGIMADSSKEIHTIAGTEGFLDGVLPHEITHLIFRDFVGMSRRVPLWMDEGVAQWEEAERRQMARYAIQDMVRRGDVMSIERLTQTDIRYETNPSAERVAAFYIQAISLVDFLITTYGAGSFTELCRNLRDGKSFEDSLRSAYRQSFETYDEMELRWRRYLQQS